MQIKCIGEFLLTKIKICGNVSVINLVNPSLYEVMNIELQKMPDRQNKENCYEYEE